MPPPVSAQHPMTPRVARVRRRRRAAPRVFTLDIDPPETDGRANQFIPGQFSMLTVFGVGEVPISLSGDPAESGRLTYTIRAVGAVSAALTRLRPGDAVGLRGPFGAGWPMEAAAGQDVLLVAGGLGLAPLRPVLCRLLAERARFGRVVLLYGARSPEDVLFRREIETWRRRGLDIEVTVDHAAPGWTGRVGVVTALVGRAVSDPAQSVAFVCGPEVMMRFAIAALRDAGLGDESIYLSMERNMKCAVGFCGHCQFGPAFVCRDGPVLSCDRVRALLALKEI
ncbi:MAG: FAD/NAD(P)-binding protein [Alphaproteobacteria bacterium]